MLTPDDNGSTMGFAPVFTITNRIATELTRIERARGFLEAATLSESWVRDMARRAFVLEAHHTTHIEGTRLTVAQSEGLLDGKEVPDTDPDDARELLNYRAGYDFKRLFTISEFYDRDRPTFYDAIQSVRAHGMDMTAWLEYFVHGLATQLTEVKARGEQVIRRDVLAEEHRLSGRQATALGFVLERGSLTIQDFEGLWPDVNRRSLQRDLRLLTDKRLLVPDGSTNQLVYRFRGAS